MQQTEGRKARRAVWPVKLLMSWCEPEAPGDTRDEWTHLAYCVECVHKHTHMPGNSAPTRHPITSYNHPSELPLLTTRIHRLGSYYLQRLAEILFSREVDVTLFDS